MADKGYLNQDEEDEDSMEGMFLRFASNQKDYCVPLRNVTEIIALPELTPIPDTPAYVRGVLNLRGRIIPAIDLRYRLGEQATVFTDRTCAIILQGEDALLSLIVDIAREVLRLSDSDLEPPPIVPGGQGSRFVKAMAKAADNVLIVLDLDELFRLEELDVAALGARGTGGGGG